MRLEKIKSDGLAHLSYFLGDGDQAVVIDPRRDCDIYLDIAAREGMRITRIFETHRNEDYVIGSTALVEKTGATVHHGAALDFSYGEAVSEGDTFDVGTLRLDVLETPGHTMESISLVLRDTSSGDTPVGVFTGDVLFVGDVGRTDFFPDRAREVSGMLYDSIFDKLLPLGDQALLYPAHGAGSVCGDSMADREFSTLGCERLTNPALQVENRDAFIERKLNEHHDIPPYFRMMETYNIEGAPVLSGLPRPVPMDPGDVENRMKNGAVLIDIRSPEACAGAYVPGSLSLPLEMIPAYVGYLVDYDHDIILLPESLDQIEPAVRFLVRIGYDRVVGHLKGGMTAWEVSGRDYDRIGAMHAATLSERLKNDAVTLLDVRKITEYKTAHLKGAQHIFLGDLPNRLDEIDRTKPVVTFCGSGRRALVAASILTRNGFDDVADNFGSMAACRNIGCAIESD